jgi:hypothetical protein
MLPKILLSTLQPAAEALGMAVGSKNNEVNHSAADICYY